MDPLELAKAPLFVSLVSLLISIVAVVIAFKPNHDSDTPTTEEKQPPQ